MISIALGLNRGGYFSRSFAITTSRASSSASHSPYIGKVIAHPSYNVLENAAIEEYGLQAISNQCKITLLKSELQKNNI